MSDTCASCRFYVKPPLELNGQCRSGPPHIFAAAVNMLDSLGNTSQRVQVGGAWPPVPPDGWCGRYDPNRDWPEPTTAGAA